MKTDKLEKLRKETVDKIRQHIKKVQTERSLSWKCKGTANQTECEALVLGHFIKSVTRYRLNDDLTWTRSLRDLSSLLKGIADLCFPQMYNVGDYRESAHTSCSWVPELHRVVDESLNSVEGLKLSDFRSSFGNTARFVDL
jgi:hypothetical protein